MSSKKELEEIVHGGKKIVDSAIILLSCVFGASVSILISILTSNI